MFTLAPTADAACLNILPKYGVSVLANGFEQQDCENSPLMLTQDGPSLLGSSDARGTAGLVSLKAFAESFYVLLAPGSRFSF